MENSIENIWKNGNHSSNKTLDFYDRESGLWFSKINNLLNKDNKSLIPAGIIICGVLLIFQELYASIFAALLISSLFLLNAYTIKKLNAIELGDNIERFMRANQKFIKNQQRNYLILMGLVMPLFVLVEIYLIFNDSKVYTSLFIELENTKQIVLVLFLYFCFSAISIFAYLASNQAIYGDLIKKLDTIVKDLDEKRQLIK